MTFWSFLENINIEVKYTMATFGATFWENWQLLFHQMVTLALLMAPKILIDSKACPGAIRYWVRADSTNHELYTI